MEESYKAVAVNDSSVKHVFFNSFYGGDGLSSETILFLCPVMVILTLLFIMKIIIWLHVWRRCLKKNHSRLKTPMKVNILSFTIVSFVRLSIFIVFDGLAVAYELPCTDPRVSSVCKFVQLLYHVPLALLVGDLLLMIVSLLFVTVSIVILFLKLRGDNTRFQETDGHYYCLTVTIVCLIFSCILHTPYITMAYLSDAHYATSVLVYYMTILFIELGLIHHTLKLFFELYNKMESKFRKYLLCAVAVPIISVLVLLVYGLVICLSFFYYYIPINNTITDLPNEGIIVYQTALLLVGAYITYKAVFQKERKLKEVHALDDSICHMNKAEVTTLNDEIASLNKTLASVDSADDRQIKEEITQKKKRIDVLHKLIRLLYIHRSIMHLHNASSRSSAKGMLLTLQKQEEEVIKSLKDDVDILPSERSYIVDRRDNRKTVYDEQNDLGQTSTQPDAGQGTEQSAGAQPHAGQDAPPGAEAGAEQGAGVGQDAQPGAGPGAGEGDGQGVRPSDRQGAGTGASPVAVPRLGATTGAGSKNGKHSTSSTAFGTSRSEETQPLLQSLDSEVQESDNKDNVASVETSL